MYKRVKNIYTLAFVFVALLIVTSLYFTIQINILDINYSPEDLLNTSLKLKVADHQFFVKTPIILEENQAINKTFTFVLPEGIFRVSSIINQSGLTNDLVRFVDASTFTIITASIIDEGKATLTLSDNIYDITYNAEINSLDTSRYITIDFPQGENINLNYDISNLNCYKLGKIINDSYNLISSDMNYNSTADLNKDNIINSDDRDIWSINFENETYCEEKLIPLKNVDGCNLINDTIKLKSAELEILSNLKVIRDENTPINNTNYFILPGRLMRYSNSITDFFSNEQFNLQDLSLDNQIYKLTFFDSSQTFSDYFILDFPQTNNDIMKFNCSLSSFSCYNLLLLINSSKDSTCANSPYNPKADLNKDKTVNQTDILLWEHNLNETYCAGSLMSTINPCLCTPNWVQANTTCLNDAKITYYNDTNKCNQIPPANITAICDSDNNGIIGSLSGITSSNVNNLSFYIDNSILNSSNYTGTKTLEIKENTTTRVRFSYTFSSPLNLNNISIKKQAVGESKGYLIVKGISQSKTFYVDRINSSNSNICIKNSAVIDSAEDISSRCSQSLEYSISCPGSNSSFSCTLESNYFVVTGLQNSGVEEMNIISTSSTTTTGTTSGTSKVSCTPTWQCTDYSSCISGVKSRTCTDLKNCNNYTNIPTQTETCIPEICTPDIQCGDWLPEECPSNKTQTRVCTDNNNCQSPVTQKQSCRSETKSSKYIYLIIGIIVVIIIVITLILYFILKKNSGNNITIKDLQKPMFPPVNQ